VQTLIIVLNAGSGHDDKDTAQTAIRAELEAAGRPFEILTPEPQDIASAIGAAIARAEAREPRAQTTGILVAAGGDGTLNAVAAAALETGWTLGIVPLGTFNFYARDLGIPLDAAAATRVLLEGQTRAVALGRVNGHLFLNNASFGLYRKLLEDREEMKNRLGRYRLVAVFAALLTLLRHRRNYRLALEVDGRQEKWRTPMLFFGLNALQLEKLALQIAECAADDRLAVIAPPPLSRWRLLLLALKGALHQLDDNTDLRCRCAARVRVDWPGHRHARVAVDGESFDCTLPLEVEVLPRALRVLIPRSPEVRE
jgi:diacylglycerol kinase family enzyme